MKRIAFGLFVAAFGLMTVALAQQRGPGIRGVWKVVEVNGGNEGTITSPQPGLYMFTDQHYSMMRVTGTRPRPKFESNAKATDAEKVATYDGLFAQSGTYQISGSTITTRPLVAKAEFPVMGPPGKAEIKIDGNTLWWTAPGGQVLKFTRVE
jgi:lipocalin-like protein